MQTTQSARSAPSARSMTKNQNAVQRAMKFEAYIRFILQQILTFMAFAHLSPTPTTIVTIVERRLRRGLVDDDQDLADFMVPVGLSPFATEQLRLGIQVDYINNRPFQEARMRDLFGLYSQFFASGNNWHFRQGFRQQFIEQLVVYILSDIRYDLLDEGMVDSFLDLHEEDLQRAEFEARVDYIKGSLQAGSVMDLDSMEQLIDYNFNDRYCLDA